MADNVRGLKIDIEVDGARFNKSMNAIRKDARSSQKEFEALQKSLEIEFDSQKFSRAQKIAQEAIDNTAQQADVLRERLRFLEESGAADTSHYRKIRAELAQTELKGRQLEEQLERLNQLKFDQLGNKISDVGSKITSAGQALTPISVGATATATGLGAIGANAISTADDIATLATQYDISADALQRFNYVALQTDTDSQTLYKSFVKMRAGIADIATGATSVASTALQKLNLDLNNIGSSEDQFYAIITALADMEDRTQMVAIANDVFGEKLANNLLPLIYSGSDAIKTYAAEYENLGALSEEQVGALAEFDNLLNTVKTQLTNAGLQIGSSLLPIMQVLADFVSGSVVPRLQTLADWFNSLNVEQQKIALGALIVLAALAPLTIGIGKLVTAAGSIVRVIPQINGALAKLAANPVMLTITLITAALLLLYSTNEAFRASINELVAALGNALMPILDVVLDLLAGLLPLLVSVINAAGDILAVVINIVSRLLSVLAKGFEWFGEVIRKVFLGVVTFLNYILRFVGECINFFIDMINGLVDGANKVLRSLGMDEIGKIKRVSLEIDTSALDNLGGDDIKVSASGKDAGTSAATSAGTTYDLIGAGGTTGDIYNNDYSTSTTTQNVTVVIENYSDEVDVDDLVNQINIKLAEAM